VVHPNPLSDLIQSRLIALGLDEEALGYRLGYGNPLRAAGRVHALCYGHLTSRKSRNALTRLPDALEVPSDIVDRAVVATEQVLADHKCRKEEERRSAQAKREADWVARFRPHAVIHTERTVPSQITICGLTGGPERWLVIPLDRSQPPVTFAQQALGRLPTHVPFFGKVLGFTVNYAPDQAIRFDLAGHPIEVLPKAYRAGEVFVSLGGRGIPPRVLARIIEPA
jgi:hypothetical protein